MAVAARRVAAPLKPAAVVIQLPQVNPRSMRVAAGSGGAHAQPAKPHRAAVLSHGV